MKTNFLTTILFPLAIAFTNVAVASNPSASEVSPYLGYEESEVFYEVLMENPKNSVLKITVDALLNEGWRQSNLQILKSKSYLEFQMCLPNKEITWSCNQRAAIEVQLKTHSDGTFIIEEFLVTKPRMLPQPSIVFGSRQ